MQASPEEARNARAAAAAHVDDLLARRNVVGCGVGRRTVRGERTDEWAVVVYVSTKLPRESLGAHELVPRALESDGDPVRTDVVEAPAPQHLLADTTTYRPLRGGCQIAESAGGWGTLGGMVYDSSDYEPVMLTCNHVLTTPAARDALPANPSIRQPAGGSVAGNSKRIVPWLMSPLGATWAREATVDAGIVSIDAGVGARFDVIQLGRHPYVILPPSEGLDVAKRGARTLLTTGTVETVDLRWTITDFDGKSVRIGGIDSAFTIRAPADAVFAQGGDSGSLVIDAGGGSARGLLFSSDQVAGGISIACELATVMAQLGLETPCSGGLGGMIRRAVLRRRLTAWAAAERHVGTTAGAGAANALVAEMVVKVDRFRDRFLDGEGRLGGVIGETLRLLAVDLSEAVYADEEVAGLLDAAFGDWLVEPTPYDMLEHRLPERFGTLVIAALERLPDGPSTDALGWLRPTLADIGGMKVRDVLANPAPHTPTVVAAT